MHIFIGGSYNGKHDYVKQWLKEQGLLDVEWYKGELPQNPSSKTIVISGLEYVLKPQLSQDEIMLADQITKQLQLLNNKHQVIVIVTEMGRGIVPIDPQERQLRDTCGRVYQQLFKVSEHVTRIWYGLAETLK